MSITGVLGVLTAAVILGDAQRSDTFPTFDRVLLLEKTSETSANVSIGDVDGDGRLDIAVGTNCGENVIYLNRRLIDGSRK